MTTWVTVCDTCKEQGWADGTPETDGARLAALVEAAARDIPTVRVRRHSCLMGCTAACNVTIQGAGKLGYTLGRFSPDPATADAIVGYAALHAESATGQVPYRSWPVGVKGHFVTRHLPLPPDP
jgi:predicted metal-binding protein